MKESVRIARKRLPMPPIGKRNSTCSHHRLDLARVWSFHSTAYPRRCRRLVQITPTPPAVFSDGAFLENIPTVEPPQFLHAIDGPRVLHNNGPPHMWADAGLPANP